MDTPIVWDKSNNGQEDHNDDPWDDTLLIKAYEEANRLVDQALKPAKKSHVKNSSPGTSKSSSSSFAPGHFCRCTYDDDGEEYEAQIMSISGDTCVVRFLGYNNEETKEINLLKNSNGPESRAAQEREAAGVVEDIVIDDPVPGPSPKVVQAPPMPQLILPQDEALASMLMSWYMSGYHTGYYKAKKEFETRRN